MEAAFLGRNISKLSPFVSNVVERTITLDITDGLDPGGGFEWRRQDPGFPDAGLFYDGVATGAGFEVKAWYALATEVTSRFKGSQTQLEGHQVGVVLVAWMMSNVAYGQPVVLDVAVFNGHDVAIQRDNHYHAPPGYLVVEPEDTQARTANLRQTNVDGYVIQREKSTQDGMAAAAILAERFDPSLPPHHPQTRVLTNQLMSMGNLRYRRETNFAKMGRIGFEPLKAFEKRVLASTFRERKVEEWKSILSRIKVDESAADDPEAATEAQKAIAAVYEELVDG